MRPHSWSYFVSIYKVFSSTQALLLLALVAGVAAEGGYGVSTWSSPVIGEGHRPLCISPIVAKHTNHEALPRGSYSYRGVWHSVTS